MATTIPYANLCQFVAATAGTGNFVVASAVTGSFTPANSGATNGVTYKYLAQSTDGSVWESGSGVYTSSTSTLARTTIYSTSAGTAINTTVTPAVTYFPPVNFAAAPNVIVFPSPTLLQVPFEAGTTTVFYQAAAPIGWTRITTSNDCALRIVSSGGGVTGGTNAFSSVFAQTVTGSHTMALADMVNHTHSYNAPASGSIGAYSFDCTSVTTITGSSSTSSGGMGGSSGAHNHTILMGIKYLDFLLASKN